MTSRIFNFSRFVNESYNSRINEGGGSGIVFTTNASVTASYELTKDDIKAVRNKATMDTVFSAKGYDDGMDRVGSWMLDIKSEDIKRKFVSDIVLPGKFLSDNGYDNNKSDVRTIGDLFAVMPDLKIIKIDVSVDYNDFSMAHFAGYSRGVFKKGDVVIGKLDPKYDEKDPTYSNDKYTMRISLDGSDAYEVHMDDDVIKEMMPSITATESFVSFYNDVFVDLEDNYMSHIKDGISAEIESGNLDGKIENYIDESDLNVTVDEFKKDEANYTDIKFIGYLRNSDDYNSKVWDAYWTDLQNRYSKDDPEGLGKKK